MSSGSSCEAGDWERREPLAILLEADTDFLQLPPERRYSSGASSGYTSDTRSHLNPLLHVFLSSKRTFQPHPVGL